MIPYFTLGIVIFIFLIWEAFFSGSEIALVAANRKKLGSLTQSSSRMSRLAQKIMEEPAWFLSTTLAGSNLMEVANTALVTSILISYLGNKGDFYAFLLLTPLILIFGEIFPKSLFQEKADKLDFKDCSLDLVFFCYFISLSLVHVQSDHFCLRNFAFKKERKSIPDARRVTAYFAGRRRAIGYEAFRKRYDSPHLQVLADEGERGYDSLS